MSPTARLVSVMFVALVALDLVGPRADGQDSSFHDLGELTQQGQRSVLTTPTVSVIDTSPDADAQVVMYRVVWRPVVDVSGTWQPTSAAPIEGPWLFTEVGEEGSGLPARNGEFLDAETREPITSHHADLPPGAAHLVQVELQWFPVGSAQLVHQVVRDLQVTGTGIQPLPGLVTPEVRPSPPLVLTPRALQQMDAIGTGFHVAPGLVLTNARVVEGRQTVLVGRGDHVREARVHAFDADLDLALLEHSMDAPPLPFRRSPARDDEVVRAFGCALVDASGRVVGVQRASGGPEPVSAAAALRWLASRGVLPTITDGASPGLAGVEAASVRVYAPD